MTYIDAAIINDRIYVSERDKNGKRDIKSFLPPYTFYYEDKNGEYTSLFNDKVKKVRCYNKREFNRNLDRIKSINKRTFESNSNVMFRLLEEKYVTDDTPPLQIGFIDIEVDKDPQRGYARTSEPYAIINAITIYHKWNNKCYTLLVPPPNLSKEQARDLLDGKISQDINGNVISKSPVDDFGNLTQEDGYFICESEKDLLEAFLYLIEDTDVLTGWNSEWYDIPYIVERIRIALGEETLNDVMNIDEEKNIYEPSELSKEYLTKLNLFDSIPRLKMVDHFGVPERTYKLLGRIHLDYLNLYRKFKQEEQHSYTLDFILKKEVNQNKVAYEGSLDQLYRNDFRRFAAYNRQDVKGLNALDDKMKYIELANSMAHMASVTLDKTTGSVVIIEQAIIKNLHKKKLICSDKVEKNTNMPVPGAFVVNPKKGVYNWICSYDFNSLYPTVIRMLNISPETLIGQFDVSRTLQKWRKLYEELDDSAEAWSHFTGTLEYHDIIEEKDTELTLFIEGSNDKITYPAKEWKRILKENNWALSANGTVFDLSKEGIIPDCLTKWYEERVKYQKKADAILKKIDITEDNSERAKLKAEYDYYDNLQLAKKLFLNSTYGSLLNNFFIFNDYRLGSSVTLSGRVMTKNMVKTLSKLIVGNYDYDDRVTIYGDTDSAYISVDWYMDHLNLEKNTKNAKKIADELSVKLNETFTNDLNDMFFINDRGKIAKASREYVARKGLFKDAKKRYALHVVDKKGNKDNSLKIMGMETRRSDTPKTIQTFLERLIEMFVINDKPYEEIYEYVDNFRKEFRKSDVWRQGSPRRVKKLLEKTSEMETYEKKLNNGIINVKKPNLPFQVKAAINTNKLIDIFKEKRWDYIRDGDKIEILYLLSNEFNMDSVAIKVGENFIPDWFKTLPVDRKKMEQTLINKKIDNVLGDIVGWDFSEKLVSDLLETDESFWDVTSEKHKLFAANDNE